MFGCHSHGGAPRLGQGVAPPSLGASVTIHRPVTPVTLAFISFTVAFRPTGRLLGASGRARQTVGYAPPPYPPPQPGGPALRHAGRADRRRGGRVRRVRVRLRQRAGRGDGRTAGAGGGPRRGRFTLRTGGNPYPGPLRRTPAVRGAGA
ncbi:hypothetical protein P376_5172 [Streptomyces sp. HCCB10043]|nr:hypothetical protein P376_5172 [Streptomyces sp. HCCB10043]